MSAPAEEAYEVSTLLIAGPFPVRFLHLLKQRVMAQVPWGKFSLLTAALVGFGWVLMRSTVPTEEQTYNAFAPDLKRRVDARRAANADEKKSKLVTLQDPDPKKPNWAGG